MPNTVKSKTVWNHVVLKCQFGHSVYSVMKTKTVYLLSLFRKGKKKKSVNGELSLASRPHIPDLFRVALWIAPRSCKPLLFSWIRLVVCLFADGSLDFGFRTVVASIKAQFLCVCVSCALVHFWVTLTLSSFFFPSLFVPIYILLLLTYAKTKHNFEKLLSLTSAHDCEWTDWSFPVGALRLSPRLRWINISVTRHAAQSERWISGGCGDANPEAYCDLGAKNELFSHSLQPTCTDAA